MKLKLKENKGIIVIIFAAILTLSIVSIIFLYENFYKQEPYFIRIHSDDDFEKYGFPGNGSIDLPYIIEGHSIIVPETYTDDNGSPCTAVIFDIAHVTKCFIVQNNHLTSKADCGNIPIIHVWDVNTSFIIRDNIITGSFRDPIGLCLSGLNSPNSQIHDNLFITCIGIELFSSQGPNIENNTFRTCHSGIETYDSANISIQNNFFELNAYTHDIDIIRSPSIKIINNTFTNRQRITTNSYSRYESISSIDSPYCFIINNTFECGGISLSDNDYLTATIQDNLVNGKPLGFFMNQTGLIIDISTQYGQLKLIICTNIEIKYQNLINNTLGIEFVNCTNCSCSYTNFSFIWTDGIYVANSKNISLSYNNFQYLLTGVYIRYTSPVNLFNNSFYYNYNCIIDLESDVSSYNNSFVECGRMY